jgi:phosphate transport system protein
MVRVVLRAAYHEALDALNADLSRLGALLVDATKCAVSALRNQDVALAARVVAGVDAVEDIRRSVDAKCIELLWRQQPVAGELREVAAMTEIATDASRINFYTGEIAKSAIRIAGLSAFPARPEVLSLAEDVIATLSRSIDAYRARDGANADRVVEGTATIDDRYDAALDALQAAMESDAKLVHPGTTVIFLITALQRIAEHAANIAWHTKDML